jgi:hypothetical protein
VLGAALGSSLAQPTAHLRCPVRLDATRFNRDRRSRFSESRGGGGGRCGARSQWRVDLEMETRGAAEAMRAICMNVHCPAQRVGVCITAGGRWSVDWCQHRRQFLQVLGQEVIYCDPELDARRQRHITNRQHSKGRRCSDALILSVAVFMPRGLITQGPESQTKPLMNRNQQREGWHVSYGSRTPLPLQVTPDREQ